MGKDGKLTDSQYNNINCRSYTPSTRRAASPRSSPTSWRLAPTAPGCCPSGGRMIPGAHPFIYNKDLLKFFSSCRPFCRRRINLMLALPLGTRSIQQGPGHDCPEACHRLQNYSWEAHWPQTSMNSKAPASRRLTDDTIDLQVDLCVSIFKTPSGKTWHCSILNPFQNGSFYGGLQGRRARVQRPADSDGRAGGPHL